MAARRMPTAPPAEAGPAGPAAVSRTRRRLRPIPVIRQTTTAHMGRAPALAREQHATSDDQSGAGRKTGHERLAEKDQRDRHRDERRRPDRDRCP